MTRPKRANARAGGTGGSRNALLVDEHLKHATTDLRFQREVERFWRLGPRPLAELLSEIGAVRSCMTDIETRLQRYARLDVEALRKTGGNRFPPPPLREVGT